MEGKFVNSAMDSGYAVIKEIPSYIIFVCDNRINSNKDFTNCVKENLLSNSFGLVFNSYKCADYSNGTTSYSTNDGYLKFRHAIYLYVLVTCGCVRWH